jgi:hypothetical protein
MPVSRRTRATRLGIACGITLLLLLGSIPGAPREARALYAPQSSPLRAAHPSNAAQQLAAAEKGLASGEPFAPGPAGLPPQFSPGGFTWTNLTGKLSLSPTGRIGAAAAWDPVDGYVLLFGGEISGGRELADTWSFSNGSWTNLTASVTGAPPPLVVAQLAYDPSGNDMVLFGGITGSSTLENQTWTYHDRTWTNLTGHTGATPPATLLFAFTTDTAAGEVLLFGGEGSAWGSDTWSFKAGTWTDLTATASFPTGTVSYPEAGDDPAADGVILYGIYSLGAHAIDSATLLFTDGTWHNLSALTTGQTSQMLVGVAEYLAPISSVVFVSSASYNATGVAVVTPRTAEYANETWTNVTSLVNGPPATGELPATSGLAGGEGVLAFGGATSNAVLDETWLLTAPLTLKVGATHVVEDVGVGDTFTSTLSGGYGPDSYHWSFGDGSTASTAAPPHAFARAGLFEVNLTATDVVGHVANASLWVEVDPAVVATSSADPSPATAGNPVTLVGSWTGGTAPYTYSWSLGDMNSSTASALAHTYPRVGNYTVLFTITDALGASASASLTLSVRAAPSTSSSSSSNSVSLTSGTGLYLLLGIILLAVIAGVLAAMVGRRPRSPPGPPPASAGTPPPATYGPPSPPPPGAPPGG